MSYKERIRKIPILGRLIRWIYRIIKAPFKIGGEQLSTLLELKKQKEFLEELEEKVHELLFEIRLNQRKPINEQEYRNNLQPIFIHSLWRTGSTYVWSRFRRYNSNYCYYEPFHESLLSTRRSEFKATFRETSESLSHADLDKDYFHEYPIRRRGGVPFFQKNFSYDDYSLNENQEHPDLKRYIESLLIHAKDKRPVLQFCRSPLRAKWLKRNFKESINMYLVRSPREQWESYLFFDNKYFNTVTFLIAGKNSSTKMIKPLHKVVTVPYYDDNDVVNNEVQFYLNTLSNYTLQEQYFVFYYIWLISFLEAIPAADIIIDIDLIAQNKDISGKVEDYFRTRSINVDFEGCDIRRLKCHNFTLDAEEMGDIEKNVQSLIRNRLQSEYERNKASYNNISPFISENYQTLLLSFLEK